MRSPSRSRVSSSRLRLGKLTLLSLVALLVLPVISSAQQVPNDVGIRSATDRTSSRPDDGLHYAVRTNSPRETFSSFQQVSAKFKIAFADYKNMKDRQRAENIYFVADQWRSLIDLSEVPVATRRSVGALTAAYLLDIFNRIAPPALGDVPDASSIKTDGPASFQIPNTPFRIVRIESGPRQGEFLFSAHTVEMAPRFHRAVKNLPLRSPRMVGSWVSEIRQLTGPMFPAVLLKAVPENLMQPVLGTPIWKIIAVVVLTIIVALLLLLWNHATRSPTWGRGMVGDRWRRLLSPLAVLVAAFSLHYFFASQIVVAGQFATIVFETLTLVMYLAMAWAFWVCSTAVFETAIERGNLPAQNFNAEMLRLIARIIGMIGGLSILAYGGQNIGLPVFSLLAGLGIGGLAVALAIRPTFENLIGGFILYLDKPIRVGDFCTFGDHSGTVERIGVRSIQIRSLDRTLITVPNAQFADLQIINWAQCDRMLIKQTIGLRYETEDDQLRYLLVKLREMLIGHPRIDSDTVRVRFSGYGASSLDVSIRVYAMTREWNDFFAIKEDILFRIKTIVEKSGTGFAFPSRTLYMGRDDGVDASLGEKAKKQVSEWRRTGRLPFPNFAEAQLKQLDNRVSYPPPGSPDFNATAEELEELGGERLSTDPLPDENEHLTHEEESSNKNKEQ
jgi:MscS family membrane protein